jgi:hypothetical protein
MSDFKFACPHCGQRIACDKSLINTHINCPTCEREIIVPAAPLGLYDKLTLATLARTTRQIPGVRPLPPPPPGTSGLAVASLVMSLTGVLFLPGIICGHLARAGIRKNPRLKGSGVALAGLIIGYIVLGAGVLAAALYYALILISQNAEALFPTP